MYTEKHIIVKMQQMFSLGVIATAAALNCAFSTYICIENIFSPFTSPTSRDTLFLPCAL